MTDAIEFRPVDRSLHEILVVDDDPVSRYTTTRLLRAAGFQIREAATGMEGLRLADERVSAMVLDVHLPDVDGFEVCRRLRSQPGTMRLPVLHLSAAYVKDEDKVRGLDNGADAYLTHPVEPSVLVATVQALVRARSAEDAMRRSEAKFREIYARANSGICLLDATGRFVDANPQMLNFLGRRLDEVAGLPVSAFVPPEWVERVDAFTRRGSSGEVYEQIPIKTGQGRIAHLEWHLSSSFDTGVTMAVVTDVSQRVLLEDQRREALDRERDARSAAEHLSRMKDEFIAVLSHELRTPLNAIMGWAYVLQKRGVTGDILRGIQAIERNGGLLARLIADLMDMSRLNLGKMRLEFEPVDAEAIVNSAISSTSPIMEERKVQVVHHATLANRQIRADAARLEQVVWNLLSNAIKFSPAGSTITVTTTDQNGGVGITVADQGQGIAAEFLPYLFDRFTQADAASNRFRGGLGLGLAIVQHLVQAHGGTITASSPGLGQGASFAVWLPADGGASRAADDSTPLLQNETVPQPDAVLDGLQVLVVDDDPEAREMLRIILADRGAQVTASADYAGALERVGRETFDIVISDVGMPGMDGYSLVREIRRREAGGRRVPVIALTSFTREQDRLQALAEGFDAHCPKPLRPFQLIQIIEQMVVPRRTA